ncbi:TMEM175 family protein [Roseomonas sp. WA12]
MRRGPENGYHRAEAFSDAVIAISVTLMAYELLGAGGAQASDLAGVLAAAWPPGLAFVMSFLVVGQMWIVHHNLWRFVREVDQGMLVLNLGLLLFIAVLPVAAKLLATHLNGPASGLQVAAGLYAATALGQAALFNVILRWAWDRRLFEAGMDEPLYADFKRHFALGPAIYLGAFLLNLVSPYLSIAAYLAVPIAYIGFGFGTAKGAR